MFVCVSGRRGKNRECARAETETCFRDLSGALLPTEDTAADNILRVGSRLSYSAALLLADLHTVRTSICTSTASYSPHSGWSLFGHLCLHCRHCVFFKFLFFLSVVGFFILPANDYFQK